MAEITVTRALSELKTLKARFEKSLRDLNLVAVNQGSKLRAPFTSYKKEDFEDKARAGLQSSNALYARIIALKTAIDQSNSVTKVKICGQELTIQEVLVQKKYLELKHDLLSELIQQFRKTTQLSRRWLHQLLVVMEANNRRQLHEKRLRSISTEPARLV